jgi:hypothetical protein
MNSKIVLNTIKHMISTIFQEVLPLTIVDIFMTASLPLTTFHFLEVKPISLRKTQPTPTSKLEMQNNERQKQTDVV